MISSELAALLVELEALGFSLGGLLKKVSHDESILKNPNSPEADKTVAKISDILGIATLAADGLGGLADLANMPRPLRRWWDCAQSPAARFPCKRAGP